MRQSPCAPIGNRNCDAATTNWVSDTCASTACDYKQWAELFSRLVSHWVDRHGAREVREWFFEVWNEPNLKESWTGTQGDYFKLYRYKAEAIKGVDAQLRVGGPATAKNEWVEEFLDFCEKR